VFLNTDKADRRVAEVPGYAINTRRRTAEPARAWHLLRAGARQQPGNKKGARKERLCLARAITHTRATTDLYWSLTAPKRNLLER